MQQLLLQQLPMTSTSNNNKLLSNLFSISQSSVSNTGTNSNNSLENILASQIQVLVQQLIGGNANSATTSTNANTSSSLIDATQTNINKESFSHHCQNEDDQHQAKLNDSFDNTDFLLDNFGNSKKANKTNDDSEGAMRDSGSYYEEPQMTSLDKVIYIGYHRVL